MSRTKTAIITLVILLFSQQINSERLNDIQGDIPSKHIDIVANLSDSQKQPNSQRGIVLVSPQVDNTALTVARAIAEKAQCGFVITSGEEINRRFDNGEIDVVKNIFNDAYKVARNSSSGRTIIFIDKLDAINRDSGKTFYKFDSSLNFYFPITACSSFLTELVELIYSNNIATVIGATHHPERVETAFTRAGRLDKIVNL